MSEEPSKPESFRKLEAQPEALSILRLPPNEATPPWISQSAFYSIVKTRDELSLVCETRVIPDGPFSREDGWKAFRVVGTLDFAMTGVLSALASPLAEAKISLFAVSTHDTDYLLLKARDFAAGKAVLEQAGFSWV